MLRNHVLLCCTFPLAKCHQLNPTAHSLNGLLPPSAKPKYFQGVARRLETEASQQSFTPRYRPVRLLQGSDRTRLLRCTAATPGRAPIQLVHPHAVPFYPVPAPQPHTSPPPPPVFGGRALTRGAGGRRPSPRPRSRLPPPPRCRAG